MRPSENSPTPTPTPGRSWPLLTLLAWTYLGCSGMACEPPLEVRYVQVVTPCLEQPPPTFPPSLSPSPCPSGLYWCFDYPAAQELDGYIGSLARWARDAWAGCQMQPGKSAPVSFARRE